MEFVEGETLLRKLERDGKLSLAAALNMGIGLARGLEAIAKQGIVHRDVKPANIIIARDGTAKLGDFGLAKDLLSVGANPTGGNETLGTIRYMPPEQAADARAVDYRSDIYSLAATLFHAITGRLPYPDQSEIDLLRAIVQKKMPSFEPVAPEVPEPVQRVLSKALKATPAERHRSAVAFRDDLSQALAAVTASAPEKQASSSSGRISTTSATVGVMAGTFATEQLNELVQMLGLNSRTGFLVVSWDAGEGQIAFKDGKVVAVRTRSGKKAAEGVLEILAVKRGQFEFRPGLPGNLKAEHSLAVEGILLEAMRRRDERR
jgi:serine/threonine protein kinase